MTKVISLLFSALVLTGAAFAETVYIHAGKVLAVPGEGYLSEQTIRIENGEIISVEPGYLTGGPGTRTIDLKRGYVLPGLIDSHVHLLSEFSPTARLKELSYSDVDYAFEGAANARKTLLAGFTTVQDVGGRDEAIFSLRDAIDKGFVDGPRIRASGRAVTPTGGHGDANGYAPALAAMFTGNTCNGADDCRRAVRQAVKNGAGCHQDHSYRGRPVEYACGTGATTIR